MRAPGSWDSHKDFVNPPLSSVFSYTLSLHMHRVGGNVAEGFPQLRRESVSMDNTGLKQPFTERRIAANRRQDSGFYH